MGHFSPLAGVKIVSMIGAILVAREHKTLVMIDGFIATAAA
jgi:NaMN:DMB phosphoribosyltransferase